MYGRTGELLLVRHAVDVGGKARVLRHVVQSSAVHQALE